MEELLYDKTINCPVCKRDFTSKKVRIRKLKIQEKQDDLNVVYKEINPLYYQVFVCPHCGYSGTESSFEEITPNQKHDFDDQIRYKWKSRDYGGIRTYEEAEACFKMAILVAQVTKRPQSYLGNLCIKLAWLYRGYNSVKEEEFLKHALHHFEASYQNEHLEGTSVDEMTVAYLVGELNRYFGRFKEAIIWYSKVLDHPMIKHNRQLQLKTREQWRVAKEQYDGEKRITEA
ncbi:DUF2225 domain-containing protein [Alkaliphilus crotonatoxidans]